MFSECSGLVLRQVGPSAYARLEPLYALLHAAGADFTPVPYADPQGRPTSYLDHVLVKPPNLPLLRFAFGVAGVDPNLNSWSPRFGVPYLHLAASAPLPDVVRILLDAGADVLRHDPLGETRKIARDLGAAGDTPAFRECVALLQAATDAALARRRDAATAARATGSPPAPTPDVARGES